MALTAYVFQPGTWTAMPKLLTLESIDLPAASPMPGTRLPNGARPEFSIFMGNVVESKPGDFEMPYEGTSEAGVIGGRLLDNNRIAVSTLSGSGLHGWTWIWGGGLDD
jgi:hypothetical protein